jgi:hypothetical protein
MQSLSSHLCCAARAAAGRGPRGPACTPAMLVLVTGGSSALAQTIAARIREQGHAVRLTDRAALPPAAPDIIHEDGANRMRTSVQQVQ